MSPDIITGQLLFKPLLKVAAAVDLSLVSTIE
jgi:hypothetical protein